MSKSFSFFVTWYVALFVCFTSPVYVYGYTHEIIVKQPKHLSLQLTDTETTFVVVNHIDLSGAEILLPKGCTIMFHGGSISNGTIITEDLKVSDWGFTNVTFYKPVTTLNPIIVPIVGAKELMEDVLQNKASESVEPTIFLFSASERYDWEGVLNIDRKNVTLTGGGTIEGHIHIGIAATDFLDRNYDSYIATSHSNIIISGLRFSKYKLYGQPPDNDRIETYLAQAQETDSDNISISIINACNVKIFNCFFDNVPFPIVYSPNKEYVNQNVRRLNINNCDFERCKIAVYAPSYTNNSLEYGDLMFTGNNVYPIYAGLVVSNIDGFKCIGNTFSTCSRGKRGANIIAYRPGQVMIASNSFYGEYNQNAICLFDMGTGIIQGNLFSSQGIGEDPITSESRACLLIQRIDKDFYTPSVVISNNLFSNVNRLPILIDGDIRNFNIIGNSLDGPVYEASRRTLYYIKNKGPIVGSVQPNIRSANLLEDMSGTFNLRMRVINDIMNGNTLYPAKVNPSSNYNLNIGRNIEIVKIKSVAKTNYIAAVTFSSKPWGNVISYMFNGQKFSLKLRDDWSDNILLQSIQKSIDSHFGKDFDTYIIEGILWIVGKDETIEPITPFFEITTDAHVNIQCIYQNMGYRLIMENESRASIKFDDIESGLCFFYTFDDTFVAYKNNKERPSDTIISEIVHRIYNR